MANKTIDMKALHRNEQTHEQEDFLNDQAFKISNLNISRKGSIGDELSVTNDSVKLTKKATPMKKSENYKINEYLAKHLSGNEIY